MNKSLSSSSLQHKSVTSNDSIETDRSYVGCAVVLCPSTSRLMAYDGRPRTSREHERVIPVLYSTLKLRRRRSDLCDATYDIDADGVVSPEDKGRALKYDVNNDGTLSNEEVLDGRCKLLSDFYDRNAHRMWRYNNSIASMKKEQMISAFANKSDFATQYKQLCDREQRVVLSGGEEAKACFYSPTDVFDPPPIQRVTFIKNDGNDTLTRVNSRTLLLDTRRQERAMLLKSQYDAVDKDKVVYNNKMKHLISFTVESPVMKRNGQ